MNLKIYASESNPRFKSFRKYGKFPAKLTFGFENEIKCPLNDYYDYSLSSKEQKILEKIKCCIKDNPFLYVKEEYTNNGIEVNSHPFNWNFYSKKHNFIDELTSFKNPGLFYINPNCGFHIHIGRRYFSTDHLTKMVKFFYDPKHTEFLFKISKRRSRRQFNEWSSPKIPKYTDYDENGYLKRFTYTFEEIANLSRTNFDKSCILNLYPKNTIEIRMFRGTTNPVVFRAYLEFALAVVIFTQKTDYKDITVRDFRKFVRKNLKKYSLYNLQKLLKNPSKLEV